MWLGQLMAGLTQSLTFRLQLSKLPQGLIS